jgi:trimethylamine--corrinoid protein Co-methyltransferase
VLSVDQVEAIHLASLRILEHYGVRMLLQEARDILRSAGAEVDPSTLRVRFDAALIEEALATVPSLVRLRARNPAHDIEMGEDRICFAAVGGPPHCTDLERGRRAGTLADFGDFMRLTQAFDVVHINGMPVEPIDVPTNVRHLSTAHATLTLTDKVPFVYARGKQAVADVLEMVRIARQVSSEQFAREPSVYTVVNANSPLQYDVPMAQGIIDMARAGQFTIVTPFTLAGAMAPITLAGALAQQNAEALAGIALAQIVRPGAPVGYGAFTSNVDMKSGAPAFGTPEYTKAALASGQLIRRYNVPYRSSNVNASNAPDAQAAYESMMSTWGSLLGGCHILMHGAGWLEGGLSASYEKFIIDVEILRMMAEFLQPLQVDDASLALDAIAEVGPGGHYFGAAHTLDRFETAFWSPLLSDWRNYETWQEAGALDATRRAHDLYKQTLADFVVPPLEASIDEQLTAFKERREAEGGADIG